MNTRATYIASMAALVIPGAAILAQDNNDEDGFEFHARLAGAQEVVPPDAPTTPSPGVDTESAGSIEVDVAEDLSRFAFRLLVNDGVGVTQAHLHCGRPGQNGPIIVFLAGPNDPGEDVDGLLAEGVRTNENIEQGAEACEELIGRPVRNIASLAAAAFDGLIYANVHTDANPAGEVRGQLIFGDGDDSDEDGRDR